MYHDRAGAQRQTTQVKAAALKEKILSHLCHPASAGQDPVLVFVGFVVTGADALFQRERRSEVKLKLCIIPTTTTIESAHKPYS